MRYLTWLALLLCSTVLHAQTGPPGRFRVLIPVYVDQPVPGSFGSIWETSFVVHNATDHTYIFETCSTIPPAAPCTLDLFSDEELEPRETMTRLPQRLPRQPIGGVVAYIVRLSNEPTDGRELALQLRVRDRSRNALSAGTEIPVVREAAFRQSTVHLLAVPTDDRFRYLLRLYEMNLDRAEFRVRVYDEVTGAVLADRAVTLQTPPQGRLRFQPGYAQLADVVPSQPGSAGTVRIEVTSLTPGSSFWAFVSSTNNVTQELTIVSPQ